MKLKFNLLISNTERSLFYVRELKKNNLYPEHIIYLDNEKNKNYLTEIKKYFSKNIKIYKSKKLSKKVCNFLLNLKEDFIIYSSYPGDIVKNEQLLDKKKLLHSHSGKLPEFKGSTTIYYSILMLNKIFCSTIIMNKKIDEGKILYVNEYSMPKNMFSIDKNFDSKIRAQNMIYVLKNFNKLKKITTKSKRNFHYYVIHPFLRSIVFGNYENNIRKKK